METSDVVAICSAIAAASAVVATIYQSRLSHRHDRLTVQPFLAWSEDYVQETHGTHLTFTIKNHGQGPAIIKERWFEIDAKRFATDVGGSDLVEEMAHAVLGNRAEWYLRQSGLIAKTAILPAGTEFTVARIYFPGRDKESVRAVFALCPEIDLKVRFESLYGEAKSFSALHGTEESNA